MAWGSKANRESVAPPGPGEKEAILFGTPASRQRQSGAI
jgi:hypothetical protein